MTSTSSAMKELDQFLTGCPFEPYVLERFVKGQPLYETGNVTLGSLVDVVNHQLDSAFMILSQLPQDRAGGGAAEPSRPSR